MPKARRASSRSAKAPATRGAQNLTTEKSAGVVVVHRGRRNEFLLIYSTYWEFPKGRVDANEREVDAALREVREETGLDVHLLDGFRHEVNYFYRQRNTGLLV